MLGRGAFELLPGWKGEVPVGLLARLMTKLSGPISVERPRKGEGL